MRTFKECVVKHKIDFLELTLGPIPFWPTWKIDAPCLEEWHDVVWICFLSFCNEAKDWSIAFGREVQLAALISIRQILVRFHEDWIQSI